MKLKTSILASTIFAALAVQANAATPPTLQANVFGSGSTTATFRGGATVSRGANFLTQIPADQKVGLMATVTPAAADVGKQGDLFMVAFALNSWYMRTPAGFVPWNGNPANLLPFQTKTLAASEAITVTDLEALAGTSLDGISIDMYLGYTTSTSPLIYSNPIQFTVMGPPPSSCPAGTTQRAPVTAGGKSLCVLSGTYTSNLRLTSNFEYIVSGPVFFGGDNTNSMTVTFDAGVKTYGESGADFMRVSRGSKVEINGSPEAPVIMTGAAEATATSNTTGLWGGFVVNGNATINGCSVGTALCERTAEGNAGTYGGTNDNESSGNINYLQIRYAGFEISPGNELNGLTLNGVGRGTIVDYVQVHNGSDDGYEVFGGTVNAKHLVLTGNDDDNVDWQTGWRGKIQHVLVLHKGVGERGIEADNNNAARDSLPRSKGQVANMTVIAGATQGHGIKLRDGTAAKIYNTVIKSTGAGCIDIDHAPTFLAGGTTAINLTGELTIVNSLFDCTKPFTPAVDDSWDTETWFRNQTGNVTAATGLSSYINSTAINARPATNFAGDDFFDNVDYIGAVKDTANDWTLGWTFRQPFTTLVPALLP